MSHGHAHVHVHDRQRARVYAWEDAVVTATDRSVVAFSSAQGMVDAIWSEIGLRYPPKVERLPRQARRLQADGSRLRLRLPEVIPSWLLLHELAHALSSADDGASDGHGPDFMGLYVQLLGIREEPGPRASQARAGTLALRTPMILGHDLIR